MAARLSNSLTELSDRVATVHAEFVAASAVAFHSALVAGALLVDAKTACKHGEWLPFLKRTGVAERQAQRFMTLSRAGFNSDIVSDLGGIGAALKMASDARMPTVHEQLIVFASWQDHEFLEGRPPPGGSVVVHRDLERPDFLYVDGYDVADDGSYAAVVTSRKPMLPTPVEAGGIRVSVIWLTIHNILGKQLGRAEAWVAPRKDAAYPLKDWGCWIREFDEYRAKAAVA